MAVLNLTTAKSFRQYAAIEGVNHPPIPHFFEHARPPGDAISPEGIIGSDSVNVPPTFSAVAATDLLTTAGHGLVSGTPVRFTTTTTLPAGLSLVTTYYVIASGLTADDFKVSATLGGSTVNITDAGTGTHSWARYLTADEQAEVAQWKLDRIDMKVALPASLLWIAAQKAYETNPLHKSWLVDDYYQRYWQAIYRSSDHADAAQEVTPPSASDTGDVTHDPPTVPAGVSPN
ncbi:MAG: hypothetical protein QOE26_2760 [Verrucomicrobiota bacterium]|jgi:hypothetical protein